MEHTELGLIITVVDGVAIRFPSVTAYSGDFGTSDPLDQIKYKYVFRSDQAIRASASTQLYDTLFSGQDRHLHFQAIRFALWKLKQQPGTKEFVFTTDQYNAMIEQPLLQSFELRKSILEFYYCVYKSWPQQGVSLFNLMHNFFNDKEQLREWNADLINSGLIIPASPVSDHACWTQSGRVSSRPYKVNPVKIKEIREEINEPSPEGASSTDPPVVQTSSTITFYHGTGDKSFSEGKEAIDDEQLSKLMNNVRRVLKVREKEYVIEILDRLPFKLFEGTNHFGDEFGVLLTDVHLPQFEELRLNPSLDAPVDAFETLADIVTEFSPSEAPYVRFIAARLVLDDAAVRDVFICHAGEDKAAVAKPLYDTLTKEGLSAWFDEAEIRWGQSIVAKVNNGLKNSKYVVAVISTVFLSKNWPKKELQTALNLEINAGDNRVLPLLVGSEDDIKNLLDEFPLLSEKKYMLWGGGVAPLVRELRALLGK